MYEFMYLVKNMIMTQMLYTMLAAQYMRTQRASDTTSMMMCFKKPCMNLYDAKDVYYVNNNNKLKIIIIPNK